jgi:hypothetical protein
MSKENLKLKLMYEFRNQLINLLDELIEQFPEESDLVIIRIFLKDQIPVYDVLGRYIRDLLPLKDQILKKDSDFFLNNCILYTHAQVSENRVNHFKELWLSNKLDENDREMIWKWMNLLTKIADQYYKNFGYINGWEGVSEGGQNPP